MARINLGEIFEIKTAKGFAYLHYFYLDNDKIPWLRVLPGMYKDRPDNVEELAATKEKYILRFMIGVAYHRKYVEKTGFFPADSFKKPQFMRSPESRGGDFLGWYIINTDTFFRNLFQELTSEQIQLSSWGIWSYPLLLDRLESNWSLEKWRYND